MLSRLLLVFHCRARCSPFGIQGLPDVQLARGRHGSSFLGTAQPLRFWHIRQGPDASWVQAPGVAALGFSILGSEQPLRFGDLCPSAPSCRSCRSSRGRSNFRAEQKRRRRKRRGRHEDSKAGSSGSSVRSPCGVGRSETANRVKGGPRTPARGRVSSRLPMPLYTGRP